MCKEDAYLKHRSLVLRIAYDITASWCEAEDIAQQTYLRWISIESEIQNPRAYLARIASNLALDALKRADREEYRGTYLPEPVLTGACAAGDIDRAAEIEIALMIVLGSLSPIERAVLLLHDVFSFNHGEISKMLERNPSAVRKNLSRARAHVRDRAQETAPADPMRLKRLTETFMEAAQDGNLEAIKDLLTSEVKFVGDGGGQKAAVLVPISGRERVAHLVMGIASHMSPGTRIVEVEANHRPAMAIFQGAELDMVFWVTVADDLIAQILVVRNPDKLCGISRSLGQEP